MSRHLRCRDICSQILQFLSNLRYSVTLWTTQLKLLAQTLPGVLFNSRQRSLLGEMRDFSQDLHHKLDGPLLDVMEQLTSVVGPSLPNSSTEKTERNLADLAVFLTRDSTVGFCLRRSAIRYHFLRRSGLALSIHFGARLDDSSPNHQILGHAWLTLDGEPFHEAEYHWRGFEVILSFPQDNGGS